jgi:hypothetical protein
MSIVSKMGDVPVPGCQAFRTNKYSTLKSECQPFVQQYPDAKQAKQLFKTLGDTEDVAGRTPDLVGESVEMGCHCKCCGSKRSQLL